MAIRTPAVCLLLAFTLTQGCTRAPDRGAPEAGVDSTAQIGVDSVMRSHFAAFAGGDMAGWSSLLDDAVFFTAADPGGVFASRDSARERMQADLTRARDNGIGLTIRPVSQTIWVAPDGRTATATYELDYTATYQDQRFPYRLRASYLLVRDSAGWQALAAQYSRPVAYDSLFMALVSRRLPGVARVGGEVPSAAGEIVTRFRADIRDISQASIASDAVIVTPGALLRDGEAGRQDLARWLGPAGNATEPGDGMRGGFNADGTVGWIATNLHVPVFAGPETAIAPMRALFVYRLAGDRWELIQASLSVGLKEQA
jgi:hypothetical protein